GGGGDPDGGDPVIRTPGPTPPGAPVFFFIVESCRIRPAQTRLGPTGVAVWFLFSTFCVFKAFTLFRTSPLFSCASLTSWASKDVVWSNMLEKDKAYTRDVHMMEKHPHLQPKMRAILLDWLMEVSEVYKLHRETYHLAQDYFDRFMATQRNVFKSTLQLIGITCLFIAAKVEEMYPPKVHQFAYVTDEACTEDEILSMEIIIMMELKWSLSPQTPVSWLNVYMQVAYLKETDELLLPRYPQETFTQIAQLLDLCLLDVRCLEFSNGVLAASALFHFSSLELVEAVSALKRAELEECVRWMVPFAMALREVSGASLKSFPGIPEDDVHNIQIHASYMAWLAVQVQNKQTGELIHPPSHQTVQLLTGGEEGQQKDWNNTAIT
uniref:Cyclin E1 n=1 Tax=Takifugu rubripes TaxID=31033 RepID=H2RL04_TAKRU